MERHLEVTRTARYHTAGDADQADEVWYLLHGYGQLAADMLAAGDALRAPGRLLVAPEALSRFYVAPVRAGTHAESPVGASWMTRADRAAEIRDQVAYLDTLHGRIRAGLAAAPRRVALLGFSQGATTAARWCMLGSTRVDTLVLWGGVLPDELTDDPAGRFRDLDAWVVRGERDPLVPQGIVRRTVERLTALGARTQSATFDGGHRLDDATLARLSG